MGDLLNNFTKKYFFVWRNAHCYDYLRRKVEEAIGKKKAHEVHSPKRKGKGEEGVKEVVEKKWTVRFERWREK